MDSDSIRVFWRNRLADTVHHLLMFAELAPQKEKAFKDLADLAQIYGQVKTATSVVQLLSE